MKLTKNGSRSLGKKIRVEVTTVDSTGNTVNNGQATVGGKKAKNKKHKASASCSSATAGFPAGGGPGID